MTQDNGRPRVQIFALGGFRIVVDGRDVRLRTRKDATLLLRLALAGAAGVTRDECLALLWPDAPEERARHSLSESMRGIERLTGIEIVRTPDRLALPDGAVQLDVDALDAAIRATDVYECARLYAGGFLAGWYPPTAEASHWVDAYGAAVVSRLEKGLRAQLISRRQATDSRGVRAIVDLFEAMGVATTSDHEVAAEADQITGWEALRPGEAIQPRVPLDREGPFIGRAAEMKQLTTELDRALAGELRLVLVSGDAGIGKTRTCQRLARLAALRGARLFLANCYELEQSVPFGVVNEAFGASVTPTDLAALKPVWRDALGDFIPSLAEIARGGSPRLDMSISPGWALQALGALMQSLCKQRPGLLFVDDVQWADAASCRAIHSICKRHHPTGGLLVVLALREADLVPDSAPAMLVRDVHLRIRLTTMKPSEIRALVSSLTGPEAISEAERIARRAAGNPFFARELAYAGPADGESLPLSIRQVLLARVTRLAPTQHRILALLACAGGRLHIDAISAALGVLPGDLLAPISALLSVALLEEDGSHFRLPHDVLRSTVYHSLGDAIARSLHAALARANTDHISDAARARHFELAGLADEAAEAALRGADAVMYRFAADDRLDLLQLALRTSSGTRRSEIAEAYGSACLEAGQFRRAIDALQHEQPTPGVRLRLDLAILKRSSLKEFPTKEHAVRAVDEFLERAADYPTDFVEGAREKMRFGHEAGDAAVVRSAINDLVLLSDREAESRTAARALCFAGYQGIFYSPRAHVKMHLEKALYIGDRLADPHVRIQALIGLATAHGVHGNTRASQKSCRAALQLAKKHGFSTEALRARALLTYPELDLLAYRRVLRHACIVAARADPIDHWSPLILAQLNAALAWLELGFPTRTYGEVCRVQELERGHPDWLIRVTAAALGGLAALELGRVSDAKRYADLVENDAPPIQEWMDDPTQVLRFRAAMLVRSGYADKALQLAEAVAQGCEGRNRAGFWAAALMHARLEATMGKLSDRNRVETIRREAAECGNLAVVAQADQIITGTS